MSSAHLTPPDLMTPRQAQQAFETTPAQPVSADHLPDYPGCEHEPYPVQLISTITGHVFLFGFAAHETTNTASAEVDLFDGTDATGLLAIPIALAPNESTSDGPWPRGLHFRNGLFARLTSGAANGSLYVCLRRHTYGG